MALSDGLLGSFADLVGGYFGRVQAAKAAAMDAPYQQRLQGLLGAPADNPEAAGLQGPAFGGSGLLASPNDPRAQQTFAAGLMGLGGRYADTGANMLNQAFTRAQQGDQYQQSAATQAQQWGAGHQLQLAQAQELSQYRQQQQGNWVQQFEAQQAAERARLGIDARRLQLAEGADARAAAAAAAPSAPELPKLPVGYTYLQSPAGMVSAPIPGTKDYATAVDTDKTLMQARKEITQLTDIMEGVKRDPQTGAVVGRGSALGSELWGQDAAKMSGLRASIISRVAKLRDMGVLQAGELERLEESLPDPTSIGAKFRRNKSITTSYRTLDEQFKSRIGAHREANPWLLPPVPGGQ
jgi:hypothetical protein